MGRGTMRSMVEGQFGVRRPLHRTSCGPPPHRLRRQGGLRPTMAEVGLVDVSIRDGNQSLWGATGLHSAQMLEIAGKLDRAGFRAIDFTSSTHMAVAVRYFRNNPWERIRRMRAAMPRTPLQFITTGLRFIAWEQADPDFMRIVYRRLQANGIRRFVL